MPSYPVLDWLSLLLYMALPIRHPISIQTLALKQWPDSIYQHSLPTLFFPALPYPQQSLNPASTCKTTISRVLLDRMPLVDLLNHVDLLKDRHRPASPALQSLDLPTSHPRVHINLLLALIPQHLLQMWSIPPIRGISPHMVRNLRCLEIAPVQNASSLSLGTSVQPLPAVVVELVPDSFGHSFLNAKVERFRPVLTQVPQPQFDSPDHRIRRIDGGIALERYFIPRLYFGQTLLERLLQLLPQHLHIFLSILALDNRIFDVSGQSLILLEGTVVGRWDKLWRSSSAEDTGLGALHLFPHPCTLDEVLLEKGGLQGRSILHRQLFYSQNYYPELILYSLHAEIYLSWFMTRSCDPQKDRVPLTIVCHASGDFVASDHVKPGKFSSSSYGDKPQKCKSVYLHIYEPNSSMVSNQFHNHKVGKSSFENCNLPFLPPFLLSQFLCALSLGAGRDPKPNLPKSDSSISRPTLPELNLTRCSPFLS